jgi:hypothetical protein
MARIAPTLDSTRSPEWAVLLAGARVHPTTDDHSRLAQALADGPDWKRLLNLALHHDVAPLLLRSLRKAQLTPGVSQSLIAALERATAANAMRNRLLFDDLAVVLHFLQRKRLDVIVLKGAALADTVYRDRVLRPMRDVDLLVRDDHLPDIEQFLSSRGYSLDEEWALAKPWHRQYDYHLVYYKRAEGLPVTCIELHWRLDRPAQAFRLDLEGIWTRAVQASVAGVPTRTLCPEDTVLHLCLHACKHKLTAGMRSYCDIAEAVRCYSAYLDWATFTRRAWQWQVNAFVYVPLRMASELMDAPVPDAVLERLVPATFDRRLVNIGKAAVLEDPISAALFPDFFSLRWGSIADRTAVVVKVLSAAAGTDRYALDRDARRIWWRYPLRMAHLCGSYGADFWRFLRQGRDAVTHAQRRLQLAQFLQIFEPVRRPTSKPSAE